MLCDTASLPVFQPHAMKRSCLLLQVCWRYTKISFSGLAALWWIQQLHHYVLYRTCTTSLSLLGSPTSIQFNLCYELFCWLIQVIWLHITSLHGSSCFGWNMLKHTNIRSITWFKFFINTTRIWFAKQKKKHQSSSAAYDWTSFSWRWTQTLSLGTWPVTSLSYFGSKSRLA